MRWTDQEKYVGGSYAEDFGTGDHNFCRYSLIASTVVLYMDELQKPFGSRQPMVLQAI